MVEYYSLARELVVVALLILAILAAKGWIFTCFTASLFSRKIV
jgi:hypothetical protein